MHFRRTGIEWRIILPVIVILLAVSAIVALLTLLNDIRADWALVIVLILAGVAFFAAWQPSQLAQQNRALQAELAQRTSDLSMQTTRLTALHDMAQSLGSPLRMEEVLMQGAERIKTVLDVDAAHIHLVGNEGQSLKLETAVARSVFLAEGLPAWASVCADWSLRRCGGCDGPTRRRARHARGLRVTAAAWPACRCARTTAPWAF
jgi:hypothetical protein